MKHLSKTGSLKDRKRRLITYFYAYGLSLKEDSPYNRPIQTTLMFSNSKNARLIEIMTDPSHRLDLDPIYNLSSCKCLDASIGSPAENVWINFVQEKFNNFNLYRPELRFPTDPVLSLFDPNNVLIPRRGSDSLKMQFAKLRSKFSIAYKRYSALGQNDPDNFPKFSQGQLVLEYMFKVVADDSTLRGQILRLIPGGGISSESMQENILKINISEDNDLC